MTQLAIFWIFNTKIALQQTNYQTRRPIWLSKLPPRWPNLVSQPGQAN